MRTVLKRCDTRIVMRPSGAPSFCRLGRLRVAFEQSVLGLGVERGGRFVQHQQQRTIAHEAARQGELLPLAETDLHAFRPGRAELGFEAGGETLHHVRRSGAIDRGRHRGLVVQPGNVADAHGVARPKLEAEEILKRAGQPRPPFVGANPRQIHAIDEDSPVVGLIHPAQQLHQRALAGPVFADDGDHRAGLQLQIDVVEHAPLGSRIGEGHVLEADALPPVAPARASRRVPSATRRSPPATPCAANHPARSRAGIRFRRPSRRCRPTTASPRPDTSSTCPGVAFSTEETNTTAPT